MDSAFFPFIDRVESFLLLLKITSEQYVKNVHIVLIDYFHLLFTDL